MSTENKLISRFKVTIKKQSLASRSNQDGVHKSNTARQWTGEVVHDNNAQKQPQKKALPQLITNISATLIQLKQNCKRKVLDK